MNNILIYIIIAVCLLNIIPKKKNRANREPSPFWKKANAWEAEHKTSKHETYYPKPLMTPTEFKFYKHLVNSCPEFNFHSQVCMGALLDPKYKHGTRLFWNARSFIGSKIIDFVVQNKETGEIVALIELDDRSHDSEDARAKDKRRDSYTASAGFKTFRWRVESFPDVMELRRDLLGSMEKTQVTITQIPDDIPEPEPKKSILDLDESHFEKPELEELPFWRTYLLVACIILCVLYLVYPRNEQKVVNTQSVPMNETNTHWSDKPSSNTGVITSQPMVKRETPNQVARERLATNIQLFDADIHKWNIDTHPEAIVNVGDAAREYKKLISGISPSECMRKPYARINSGFDAYIQAAVVLHSGLRKLPSEFSSIVNNSQALKNEDPMDTAYRQQLRSDLSPGHSSEPRYIAYRIANYGSAMIRSGNETMRGCN